MTKAQPIAPQDRNSSVKTSVVSISPHGLPGTLNVPTDPIALVVFAHAGGSFRCNPRSMEIAEELNNGDMATLLLDLLHPHEAVERGEANLLDINLLSVRLVDAIRWADQQSSIKSLPIGLLCTDTAAAAALTAAGRLGDRVGAIVCQGGRPDLAGPGLKAVKAPTLLIVGGADQDGIELNTMALSQLRCLKTMEVVEGATHTFADPAEHEAVKALSCNWFNHHLRTTPT